MSGVMRSFLMVCCLTAVYTISTAQALTSLNENFNASCATSSFPVGWIKYNPIPATVPLGQWGCTAVNGKGSTPGMQCTGYYSAAYHLDTSLLVTPLLNVSSYSGNVYLQFDSKTTNVHLGSRLRIMKAAFPDSTFVVSSLDTEITGFMSPVITNGDSSDWVTHYVDLTRFKSTGDFYLAFMYTSPSTSANVWYLDNIRTTTTSEVTDISAGHIQLSVVGNSEPGRITVSFSVPEPGQYWFSVTDILGREVSRQKIYTSGGPVFRSFYVDFMKGMFFLRMCNESYFGCAKVVVR